MRPADVPLLLVSGPPGVGKTTVSWEIFDQLVRQGSCPALVDIDLLGACWPVPEDDPFNDRLKAVNLRSTWQNFHAVGARCLIAAGVVEDSATFDLYRWAIPGSVATLCHLRAGPDELRARIIRRGRETGADVDRLSQRARHLATELARNDVADFWVDTDDRDVAEVARHVLGYAGGWPRAAVGAQGSEPAEPPRS